MLGLKLGFKGHKNKGDQKTDNGKNWSILSFRVKAQINPKIYFEHKLHC